MEDTKYSVIWQHSGVVFGIYTDLSIAKQAAANAAKAHHKVMNIVSNKRVCTVTPITEIVFRDEI